MARQLVSVLLLATAACATPAPATPPPAPQPSLRQAPEPPPASPDLSPIGAPASLVLVARANREAFERLSFALPRAPVETLPLGLEELLTDAPVELAVALDSPEALLAGEPDWVWSLPVASFEGALALLRERERRDDLALERRSPGVVVVSVRADPQAGTCWLAASLGPAPARIVCSPRKGALEVLGAYAARGLPTRAFGPGLLAVEATPARFAREHREKLAGLLRFAVPSPARRWTDAGASVLGADALDLLVDTQRASLSVAVSGTGLSAELALELDGQRSWLSRTVASLPPRSAGIGELFARLPESTDAAFFFTGAAPARTDEARAAFTDWLAAELGPSAPRATLELVASTFIQRSPHLYAHGDAYGKDAGVSLRTGRSLWEHTRSTYGWHVIGFDEPARNFVPRLDQGMRAYNAGSLRDFAYRTLPRLCAGLGKIKKRGAAPGLPRGSSIYELPLPGKFFDDCMRGAASAPDPAPNDAIVVVLMPIGERTFIGFGLDERSMVERMKGLSRAPGARPTPPLLGAPDVRLGGFISLSGVAGLMRFLTMEERWEWRRSRWASKPNGGNAGSPFSLSVTSAGVTRVIGRLDVDARTLADLRD